MSIEETIRQIVNQELDKRQLESELVPVSEFSKSKNISRVTIWRAEREGRLKLVRIGKKIFINPKQLI